jgi:hypothetical protein
MLYLIDEPTPFESLEVWKEHLANLLTIPEQDAEEVKHAIEHARKIIQEIEAAPWEASLRERGPDRER